MVSRQVRVKKRTFQLLDVVSKRTGRPKSELIELAVLNLPYIDLKK